MLGLKLVLGFVSITVKASLMGNGQMTAKRDVRVCDFVFINVDAIGAIQSCY